MIILTAYKWISKVVNYPPLIKAVKSSYLWKTRVNIVGISIPLFHLIVIAIGLVYYYFFVYAANQVSIIVRAPYEMCGCDSGGMLGYASEVSTTVCPSGYRCHYHNDVHWTDPECIPIGMEQADNEKCKNLESR